MQVNMVNFHESTALSTRVWNLNPRIDEHGTSHWHDDDDDDDDDILIGALSGLRVGGSGGARTLVWEWQGEVSCHGQYKYARRGM